MSILKSQALASALPHSEMTAVEVASRHIESELTNDAALINPTVSKWDQFYSILKMADGSGIPAPGAPLQLKTFFTPEGVQEHYETVKAAIFTTDTEIRGTEYVGRWFEFIDSTSEYYMRDSDKLLQWRSAFLFPVWDDGIIGEITWMTDTAEVAKYRGMPTDEPRFDVLESPVAPIFVAPRELIAKVTAYDNAWRSGDFEKRLAHFEDVTESAIGIAEVNGPRRYKVAAHTKQELLAVWNSPELGKVLELERLHTIVAPFYVFAHYRMLLDVDERTVERETVVIFPVSSNRTFIGELSYSIEVTV